MSGSADRGESEPEEKMRWRGFGGRLLIAVLVASVFMTSAVALVDRGITDRVANIRRVKLTLAAAPPGGANYLIIGSDSRAFVDVFLAVLDRSEINFRIQTEELDDMAEIKIEDGMAFFSGEKDELGATLLGANADSSWAARCALAESDCIYRHDRYYYKVCHAAYAKLHGQPLPSI